jgi:hypothetical protein
VDIADCTASRTACIVGNAPPTRSQQSPWGCKSLKCRRSMYTLLSSPGHPGNGHLIGILRPTRSAPAMVTDGLKEQTLGDFRQRLREADCHPRVTKPYSPWQQAAEGCIREVKRGSSRKMISTGSPKPLWDHCLELEALVRSCTCNAIYMTAGQVPETIMTGSTADISHIAEFGWYDWVMHRNNVPSYPDDKLILGRYLGPATDIGLALTAFNRMDNSCADRPCDTSLTRSFKALFTLTCDASLMSPSRPILDRRQWFRISLPKT